MLPACRESVWWLRALLFGIEKGSCQKLESASAREWGRRQAAASPVWSDAKWKRIGLILGVDFVDSEKQARQSEREPVPSTAGRQVAA